MLGKILGGRYELLEKIGGGGMAVVYKAKCHLLKRYVAVKVLRPELVENEEFIYRFKRESQSAASLSHPNIVNIYDVGEEDDIHYIVMEYIKGHTLKEYIKEHKRLDYEEAIRICLQISSALSHAHKNKIIHRDIKPQNILMNDDGVVKVADFGIARAVSSATVTMAGANIIGSVHYFSPEQARGGYVDKKSDIYSLGIVLYEMVTGVVPFEGDSAISVALKHIQEKVVPPGEMNPELPQSIQNIIHKAIEKELENRYDDTEEMIADMKKALKDPEGGFIAKHNDQEQTTQVMPAISNEIQTKRSTKIKNKGKNKWHGLLIVAAIIFIIAILYILFMVGRSIFLRNFVATEVEVPPIEGLSEQEARNTLRSSGLVMNIRETVTNKAVPEGHVISQNPSYGAIVRMDSLVNVILSSGPQKVIVPNVVGKPLRTAEIELENLGLKVGDPEYAYSDYPSGFVSEQRIPANTEVDEDSVVILVVSQGPDNKPIQVGNYIGLTERIAKEMILEDNLRIGTSRNEHHDSIDAGLVIRQDPQQGNYVDSQRTVDLWVSLGPAPSYPKRLEIILTGTKEFVQVKVVRTKDAFVIHDQLHALSEEIVTIDVEGIGEVEYDFWIDNVFRKRVVLNFSKKESDS